MYVRNAQNNEFCVLDITLNTRDIVFCFHLILSKAIIFGASCRVRAADKSQFRSTLGYHLPSTKMS